MMKKITKSKNLLIIGAILFVLGVLIFIPKYSKELTFGMLSILAIENIIQIFYLIKNKKEKNENAITDSAINLSVSGLLTVIFFALALWVI